MRGYFDDDPGNLRDLQECLQTEKNVDAMFAVESVVRGLASDCVNWSSKLGEFDDYFSNGGAFALLQPAKLNGTRILGIRRM